jgi:hypothetical protein
MDLMGRSGRETVFARLGAWLVVCALAVRVLIPAGYMLGDVQPGGGLPTLVICTAQGAKVVSIDTTGPTSDDKAPAHKDGKTKTDHPCVFASHGAPLAASAPSIAAQPLAFVIAQDGVKRAHQRPGLGLAAPPPPSTAPPTA